MSVLALNVARPAPAFHLSEHLIAASGTRTDDRVLVFGYEILDHLVGLARAGVTSAIGVHLGSRYCPREPVDMVWFTSVSDIDAEVLGALRGIGMPRLVAVELVGHGEFAKLRRLIACLREIGLSDTSYYKAAGRFILTAWRTVPPRPQSQAG